MDGHPMCPPARFCDTCGFCLRADAYDDHVKGKKHRRKVMARTGPSLPSQTSDAYFRANQAANAELLLLYLRCAKRLARAHGQEH
eukprot:9144234-Lingulodinium_polyedra.AAC.1